MDNTYDFWEKGIYTTEIFLKRNQLLTDQINKLSADILALEEDLEKSRAREAAKMDIIPNIENILELYNSVEDVYTKNGLLKDVLEKVVYVKNTPNTKGKLDNANFELTVYPKIPCS